MPRRLAAIVLSVLLAIAAPRAARAGDVAPELEAHALRSEARSVLAAVLSTLAPEEQRRLVGAYLAVDTTPSDPLALAACDDDGDYVVVISDAMLRLVDHAARAAAIDDPDVSARKVAEYGAFLATAQRPGERLLPPPPGFFGDAALRDVAALRREALVFVLGREVEHLRAGDLRCPRPTATKEAGDDVWTPAEKAEALRSARTTYRADARARDLSAATRAFLAGASGRGMLATLGVLWAIERGARPLGFRPTYLTHHPGSEARVATVRDAATSAASADTSAAASL